MKKFLTIPITTFLLPLVPVVFLYILFKDLNTFELTGTLKYAVKGGGPVGAYIFLLWIAHEYFIEPAMNSTLRYSELVLGQWEYRSESSKGKIGTGEVSIDFIDNNLSLGGTFRDNTNQDRAWSSDLALISSQRLMYTHELPLLEGTYLNFIVLHLHKEKGKVIKMTGHWYATRGASKTGSITYVRKK